MTGNGRFRTQTVHYTGPLWIEDAVAPELWDLLNQRDRLIVIGAVEGPTHILLGAPHQSAPGVESIADDWLNPRSGSYGRPADEMAGLLALVVYSAMRERGLRCRLVIAAHPTDHDPNKTPGSPYWDCLFSHPLPEHILELHGAARRRKHDLELSAGNNHLAQPLTIGRRMAKVLNDGQSVRWCIAAQLKPGESSGLLLNGADDHDLDEINGEASIIKLQNPALQTELLQAAGQAGIAALHLEAKRIFRKADPAFPHAPRPTPQCWDLARALADAYRMG